MAYRLTTLMLIAVASFVPPIPTAAEAQPAPMVSESPEPATSPAAIPSADATVSPSPDASIAPSEDASPTPAPAPAGSLRGTLMSIKGTIATVKMANGAVRTYTVSAKTAALLKKSLGKKFAFRVLHGALDLIPH
jgi:hypothetical protein